MLDALIDQYAKAEDITEALESSDRLEWVRRRNKIRSRTEEVVLHEIITHNRDVATTALCCADIMGTSNTETVKNENPINPLVLDY